MKPIRVALSGSGFKFPAHVGALLAIRDAGYTLIEIAGTSGGSIVATLAACGMDLEAMKALTMSRDWSDMLTFNLWTLLNDKAYCSGNNLLKWLLTNTYGRTFSMLQTRLVIMASDVSNEAPFEFSQENTPDLEVALAARASASIPFVYAPIPLYGAGGAVLLMDGGMCNNIPVDKLTVDAVPRIGIQLTSKTTALPPGDHSIFSTAPRVVDLMLSSNENTHVDMDEHEGAHFAFIETGFASGLDRNMNIDTRMKLFNNGYAGAQNALAQIQ
jgi:NTE family protein